MKSYTQSIEIEAAVERVFGAYVEEINKWWPWQGKDNSYSWAPEGVEPSEIHFEPRAGGRYYERFADGSEYVIGQIKVYEPPHKLSFSWQGRDWPPGESLFELSFEAQGEGTLLTLTHSGFEIFGDEADEMVQGYTMGSAEILGFFKAWLDENAVKT
jgi:uncharacterized protein YndB with AHSA1/START domain